MLRPPKPPASVKSTVEFPACNDIPILSPASVQDFKHFGFAVSVLILNEDGLRIVRLLRKEACYCMYFCMCIKLNPP